MKLNQRNFACFIVSIFNFLLLTATAYSACTVSSTSINFGNYDVLSSAAATGSGSVSVSCNKKATVEIAIGASSESGAFSPRRMNHVSLVDTLEYDLYTTVAMIQIWGDGTSGTSTASFNIDSKRGIPTIGIYGKIDPLQNVPAGRYSDQLVVTVTY